MRRTQMQKGPVMIRGHQNAEFYFIRKSIALIYSKKVKYVVLDKEWVCLLTS